VNNELALEALGIAEVQRGTRYAIYTKEESYAPLLSSETGTRATQFGVVARRKSLRMT
jgi:hypothetical protein